MRPDVCAANVAASGSSRSSPPKLHPVVDVCRGHLGFRLTLGDLVGARVEGDELLSACDGIALGDGDAGDTLANPRGQLDPTHGLGPTTCPDGEDEGAERDLDPGDGERAGSVRFVLATSATGLSGGGCGLGLPDRRGEPRQPGSGETGPQSENEDRSDPNLYDS